MPCLDLIRSVPVVQSPRVMQMSGLFDVPPWERSEQTWTVNFELPESWHVGLIVGPSGSGKTTLAKALWGEKAETSYTWDPSRSILDAFPASMSIKTITMLLSSVGFASPPLWVRPFHVLSTGEQFRVSMARLLAEEPELAVVDEFTSVVDRTVARIGSAAIAKTVREKHQQFVAVTCHYDVLEWLQPDWVYEPHTGTYTGRAVWRHPAIPLTVRRVDRTAWRYFRDYHYLSAAFNAAARAFCAFWGERPVAFASCLHFPHPKTPNMKREHRTVCLPDFQGVGIGNSLSNYLAATCTALGYRYVSITTHPAMVQTRLASKKWRLLSAPSLKGKMLKNATIDGTRQGSGSVPTRLRATFEYIGAPLDKAEAACVWGQ